jgi:hypothetical protein
MHFPLGFVPILKYFTGFCSQQYAKQVEKCFMHTFESVRSFVELADNGNQFYCFQIARCRICSQLKPRGGFNGRIQRVTVTIKGPANIHPDKPESRPRGDRGDKINESSGSLSSPFKELPAYVFVEKLSPSDRLSSVERCYLGRDVKGMQKYYVYTRARMQMGNRGGTLSGRREKERGRKK